MGSSWESGNGTVMKIEIAIYHVHILDISQFTNRVEMR